MNILHLHSVVARNAFRATGRDGGSPSGFRDNFSGNALKTGVTAEGQTGVNPGFALPNPAPEILDKKKILSEMTDYVQNRFDPKPENYPAYLSYIVRHARLSEHVLNKR